MTEKRFLAIPIILILGKHQLIKSGIMLKELKCAFMSNSLKVLTFGTVIILDI